VYAPTLSTAIKVFHPKQICEFPLYISNTNLEKISPLPALRISQNNSLRVIFPQKICKNCTSITIKGHFKTMEEEK
jgi:hypothetical protein